jgi:hypothetical protein
MSRIGYYVEGKFFYHKSAQAIAFAQFRADEFGRDVTVTLKDFNNEVREVGTASPSVAQVA